MGAGFLIGVDLQSLAEGMTNVASHWVLLAQCLALNQASFAVINSYCNMGPFAQKGPILG